MLFKAKEIKPNILIGELAKSRGTDPAKILLGPGGDSHILQNTGKRKPKPPPSTPLDGYFDASTSSPEGYSFGTNPTDMNSLTSSDWGDEGCVSLM
ncbi:unnamed protein product [Hydatigera taeniaeformis]|uniref:Cadherin_C domain-containing protein n=1 Tax=Hydatigena taeniaeformis TaxID=6205 RepID=A0A0R3WV25_HYDTA|nr:unnamed protein product [Hydatigera taeniaeformis]